MRGDLSAAPCTGTPALPSPNGGYPGSNGGQPGSNCARGLVRWRAQAGPVGRALSVGWALSPGSRPLGYGAPARIGAVAQVSAPAG
jgi:hypothetical protein